MLDSRSSLGMKSKLRHPHVLFAKMGPLHSSSRGSSARHTRSIECVKYKHRYTRVLSVQLLGRKLRVWWPLHRRLLVARPQFHRNQPYRAVIL